MRTQRRLVFSVIAVSLGLTVCLGLSEIIFRLKGHRTWRYQPDLERPTIHEPDPVLGWKNKPGSYLIPPYSSDAEAIKVTFLADGRRATAEHPNPRPHTFLVFGGSITQGWAISDEATFAWKLQRKYPYVEVLSYGTTPHFQFDFGIPTLQRPSASLFIGVQALSGRTEANTQWVKKKTSRFSSPSTDF